MKNHINLLILFFPILCVSQSGSKNFIDQNFIEVIGIAKMEIVPDLITLSITLNEKSSNSTIDKLEKDLIDILNEAEVDLEKDVSIHDFSSNLKFYFLRKNDIIKTKEYNVVIYDSEKIALLYYNLEQAKISDVKVLKTDHSNLLEIESQIKEEAVENAMIKAESLVKVIGRNIGKAIYIKELTGKNLNNTLQGRTAGVKIRGMRSYNFDSYEEQINRIEFEKIKIEESILVRFEITD